MLTSLLNLIPSLHHDSKSAAAESDPSTTNNNVATTTTTVTEQPSATGARKLHIAMIECDIPVPAVAEKFGSYGNIFDRLLTDAAHRVYGRDGIEVETSLWNVVEGGYPDEETMKMIDCILVSGSSASAYDDLPWIKRLGEFIQTVYLKYPHIKLIGSCFGHQIISQSLFPLVSPSHATSATPIVTNNPRGWTIGQHPITVPENPPFAHLFSSSSSDANEPPQQLQIQFIHHDHVNGPVPAPFVNFGTTETCAVQGIYQKGRVFTTQGHAEFDRFINKETLLVFTKSWEPADIEKAKAMVERGEMGLGAADAGRVADAMVRFCFEDAESVDG